MDLYKRLTNFDKLFVIAGTCVVEDENIMMKTAESLCKETEKRGINFVFKASFLKSNRTSITSFTGPGIQEGLEMLSKIKKEFNVPLLTDVHETSEIKAVAEVVDIIQIPAFLSRQTVLISKAAQTGRIINIKKGQFMAPEDMINAAEKITAQNNFNLMLTERGTTFGYHNLVVDFRGFAVMKSIGFPVVYDVTHSLQRPSINKVSGGNPEYAIMMAKAALSTNFVDGLFFETHPYPEEALSDAASMISLEKIPNLLDECLKHFRI